MPVFELPPGARPKPAYRARPAKPSFLLTLLELIPQQETRCHNTEKSPVRGHPRFHSFTRALSLHWFPITSWSPLPTPLIPTGGGIPVLSTQDCGLCLPLHPTPLGEPHEGRCWGVLSLYLAYFNSPLGNSVKTQNFYRGGGWAGRFALKLGFHGKNEVCT